jgi:hypothetical protein
LPAETTIDPAVPAVNLKSWILDIDSAVTGTESVPIDKVEELSVDLAERAYRFFRYAVTSDFLTLFQAPS